MDFGDQLFRIVSVSWIDDEFDYYARTDDRWMSIENVLSTIGTVDYYFVRNTIPLRTGRIFNIRPRFTK